MGSPSTSTRSTCLPGPMLPRSEMKSKYLVGVIVKSYLSLGITYTYAKLLIFVINLETIKKVVTLQHVLVRGNAINRESGENPGQTRYCNSFKTH